MALVNEHFFKAAGQLSVLGHSQKDQYFQDNAPQARRHPSGYRRRYPPTAASLHPSDAQGSGRDGRRQDISWIRPRTGIRLLIDAVIKHDYAPRGIHFSPQEIFINDGAKSDTGNIGDILRHDNSVGITDPIYPVYIDSNVMCGRAGILEEDASGAT